MTTLCPETRSTGVPVPLGTVRSLVRAGTELAPADAAWFYCDLPACDVVYFTPDGRTIRRGDLRVRVGAKETDPPHTVCYCFGHTVEGIRDEIARTGESTVVASITAKVRAGECSCETSNPKGRCCLGDVNRAVKDALASAHGPADACRRSGEQSSADHCAAPPSSEALRDRPADAAAGKDTHGCCGPGTASSPPGQASAPTRSAGAPERAGLLASAGSVVAAVLASACCWLPLLLVAFGASAAGVSGVVESYRPWLLGAAALGIGAGFYFTYFRARRCGPGDACVAPNPKLVRRNKVTLWVASGLVLAFAAFPNYAGALIERLGGGPAAAPAATDGELVEIEIQGMTCSACAATLTAALRGLPGVLSADVNFGAATARVTLAPHADREAVVRAIAEHGYRGRFR